jgi:hypothetical protein
MLIIYFAQVTHTHTHTHTHTQTEKYGLPLWYMYNSCVNILQILIDS